MARILKTFEETMAWLAAAATILSMVIIVGEIIFRYFGSFIPGSVEIITNYLIVAIAFLPLARLERRGDMIAMDLFSTLAGPRFGSFMDRSSALISVVMYAILTVATSWYGYERFAEKTYVLTATYPLITWPAYFLLPLAFLGGGVMALVRALVGPEKETTDDGNDPLNTEQVFGE